MSFFWRRVQNPTQSPTLGSHISQSEAVPQPSLAIHDFDTLEVLWLLGRKSFSSGSWRALWWWAPLGCRLKELGCWWTRQRVRLEWNKEWEEDFWENFVQRISQTHVVLFLLCLGQPWVAFAPWLRVVVALGPCSMALALAFLHPLDGLWRSCSPNQPLQNSSFLGVRGDLSSVIFFPKWALLFLTLGAQNHIYFIFLLITILFPKTLQVHVPDSWPHLLRGKPRPSRGQTLLLRQWKENLTVFYT